jgi:hypothetical protein
VAAAPPSSCSWPSQSRALLQPIPLSNPGILGTYPNWSRWVALKGNRNHLPSLFPISEPLFALAGGRRWQNSSSTEFVESTNSPPHRDRKRCTELRHALMNLLNLFSTPFSCWLVHSTSPSWAGNHRPPLSAVPYLRADTPLVFFTGEFAFIPSSLRYLWFAKLWTETPDWVCAAADCSPLVKEPPWSYCWWSAPPHPFLLFNPDHPSSDLRPGEADTLSVVSFLKEPLRFYEIEPAVLGVIQKLRFFVLKTYFLSVNQKYVFRYLQNCHWFCFSHNFSILTPIWPVQVALDSYLRALHVSIAVQ